MPFSETLLIPYSEQKVFTKFSTFGQIYCHQSVKKISAKLFVLIYIYDGFLKLTSKIIRPAKVSKVESQNRFCGRFTSRRNFHDEHPQN